MGSTVEAITLGGPLDVGSDLAMGVIGVEVSTKRWDTGAA
jgi:hypothetical protein